MAKRTGSAPYFDPQKNKAHPQSNPTPATPKVGDDDKVIHVSESQEPLVNPLLNALWRSPDRHHQIGVMDRQTKQFTNIPVKGAPDAVERAHKLSEAGMDVYFGCAEYETPVSRLANNASGAWGFWMDLDCGEAKAEAGKGYLTAEEAEHAIGTFCSDTGLPAPTHVVDSGGGLHVYWMLDREVEREVWRASAAKLKALTKTCGLLADGSRTSDIASVLRIPGTSNYKYTPPRPVSLKYASNILLKPELMSDAIEEAHDRLCSMRARKPASHSAKLDHTPASAGQSQYGPPNLPRLASALVTLDPDCDDETWKLRRIAPMADAARQYPDYGKDLCDLARSWSSGELRGVVSRAWVTPGGNGRTGEEIFDEVWVRFLNNRYDGTPVTLGTIYFDAKAAGWDKCVDPGDQFQIVQDETGGTA